MTAIVLLADGASIRVHATSTGRVALTIHGREDGGDLRLRDLPLRLSLNADEAADLGAALVAAALQLEAQQ